MRELELIERIEQLLGPAGPRVLRGIGDDAAVVRAQNYCVTSIDSMIDGVHFRQGEISAQDIGHRALAGALSDLAAMGAHAGEAYLSLGLPEGSDSKSVLALVSGARNLAVELDVSVAGGDVTRSPVLMVTFAVTGWVEDPGELVGRDGAQVGDLVAVTGRLGGAGAGLALLEGRADPAILESEVAGALRWRYARPWPRLAAGRELSGAGASSMIDLSDGLATDAGHIARRSGVRLELFLARLPLAPGVEQVAEGLGVDPRVLAATAGDDYELCVCLPAAARELAEAALSRVGLTWVGEVIDGEPGVSFADARDQLVGFEHTL